jgi:hypothetical protein
VKSTYIEKDEPMSDEERKQLIIYGAVGTVGTVGVISCIVKVHYLKKKPNLNLPKNQVRPHETGRNR